MNPQLKLVNVRYLQILVVDFFGCHYCNELKNSSMRKEYSNGEYMCLKMENIR